jgi:hypothetical protein
MVPVERIELPTFGLQNRCSTAELNRRIEAIGARRKYLPHGSIFGRSNTRLVRKGPEPRRNLARHPAHRKGGLPAAISCSILAALLAEMPPAILAAEPGAGDADKTVAVGIGIAANRSGGDAYAAVLTASAATPAATSPGQKPLLSSQRFRFEGCAIVKPV